MTETPSFIITHETFEFMKKMAVELSGIVFSKDSEDALYNRVVRRVRELKLSGFEDYCEILEMDLREQNKFINLITNQSTYFFREKHHFVFLKKYFENVIKDKKQIRILSAGCATGEETYSIAITALEAFPDIRRRDFKVFGMDINTDSLDIAKQGVYPISQIRNVPLMVRDKWILKGVRENMGLIKVSDDVKDLVSFERLNLLDSYLFKKYFDIIFCRNVIIYFSRETAKKVLMKLHQSLKPEGILIIGYSESLQELKRHYDLLDKTTYKKLSE